MRLGTGLLEPSRSSDGLCRFAPALRAAFRRGADVVAAADADAQAVAPAGATPTIQPDQGSEGEREHEAPEGHDQVVPVLRSGPALKLTLCPTSPVEPPVRVVGREDVELG